MVVLVLILALNCTTAYGLLYILESPKAPEGKGFDLGDLF